MKKQFITFSVGMFLILCLGKQVWCQRVGINTTGALPNASALLDVNAAPGNNMGILIPRLALTQTSSNAPIGGGIATSLLVYNTVTVNDVIPGYYYWDGTQWVRMLNQAWLLTGNAGTTAGVNFLGTTDAKDLVFKTNNTEWMRIVTAGNVGIGTSIPNPSALVDMTSTTQGLAIPRMTTVQRYAIAAPAAGLIVYDINLKGVYYYDGAIWDCLNNPAGTIQYFANATAPHGYLECNGQSVSTTTYPELFAAIGYLYGGSGAAFNVPDLRGQFVRGYDDGRGVDAGRVLGTTQLDALQNITGTLLGIQHYIWSGGTGAFQETNTGANSDNGSGSYVFNASFDASRVARTSTETRPTNVALLPCIKF